MNVGMVALLVYGLLVGGCFVLALGYHWLLRADGHPIRLIRRYVLHFKQFWFPGGLVDAAVTLVVIFPFLFLVDAVHEGSHSLASIATTGTHPRVYAPFPVYVAYLGPVFGVSIVVNGGLDAIPQYVQSCVLVVLTPFLACFRLPMWAHVCARTYFLATTGGLAWNLLALSNNYTADWPRYQVQHDLSDGALLALTLLLLLPAALHFAWLPFCPRGRSPSGADPDTDLALFRTHSSAPAWPAFAGAVAVGAALNVVYMFVAGLTSSPDLEKDHTVFRAPFAIAIACTLVSGAYLVAAARHRKHTTTSHGDGFVAIPQV